MCAGAQGFCVLRLALVLCLTLPSFSLPVVFVLRPSFQVGKGLRTWLGVWLYFLSVVFVLTQGGARIRLSPAPLGHFWYFICEFIDDNGIEPMSLDEKRVWPVWRRTPMATFNTGEGLPQRAQVVSSRSTSKMNTSQADYVGVTMVMS
jgi:hypothetical protein